MSVSTSGRGAWAEPAVDLVAPGVYRVPLPLPNDGLTAVNVYVLTGSDAVVLIDSGWSIPEARELLAKSLSELGLALGDIRRFLVTHMHRDHYSQAVAVRRDFGTSVALGAGERPALEAILDPATPPLGAQLRALRLMGGGRLAEELSREMDGEGRRRDGDWGLPDEWLVPGELVTEVGRVLEIIETPGHTQGHVVFHDTEHALLFAGDHVLPQITPSIGMEPVHSENPLGQFLDSLAVVRSRPDAMLLPAHGPVAESVHARVDELIDHHGQRLEAIEKVCLAGASTGFEVAGQLAWTRRELTLSDLDPFNQLLAINETGAHLQLLLAQGRLRSQDIDGVRHYTGA